jgi:hypothetical protein
MKQSTVWLLILVLLAGGGGYYIWQQNQPQKAPVPAESQPLALPEKPPEPEIKYPVPEPPVQIDTQISSSEEPEEEVEEPLPPLEASDDAIKEQFARLFDQSVFGKLFIFKAFIQRFVVIVDNLSAPKLPQKYRLTTPPPQSFIVNKNAQDKLFIDPRNYQRYATYVNFIEAIDTQTLAAAYVHFYPLFQQAYEAMGYPDQYFNDRLVEVIDHLLATPDVLVPIELIRPNVFYKFADPQLESLSSGQKILLRIGYDNAFRVKTKLKELREAITSLAIGF